MLVARGKMGYKAAIRDKRLRRVVGGHLGRWILLSMFFCVFCSAFVAIYIRRLSVPEGDLNDDFLLIAILILVLVVTMVPVMFLTTVVYTRLFIAKKGKSKAMKYLLGTRKLPSTIGGIWYRACGITRSDIQEYLGESLV